VSASADPKVTVGFAKPELLEEDIRHVHVEVLSGMDQQFGDRVTALSSKAIDRPAHNTGLDELGPRPDHGCNLQVCSPEAVLGIRCPA